MPCVFSLSPGTLEARSQILSISLACSIQRTFITTSMSSGRKKPLARLWNQCSLPLRSRWTRWFNRASDLTSSWSPLSAFKQLTWRFSSARSWALSLLMSPQTRLQRATKVWMATRVQWRSNLISLTPLCASLTVTCTQGSRVWPRGTTILLRSWQASSMARHPQSKLLQQLNCRMCLC